MPKLPKNETFQQHNPRFCGKKGRSGPARGNMNALRHGLKAGKLPSRLQYIEHRINFFRRHLEETVMAIKGEVSITDAASINSAAKWERHGVLAGHWLRTEADKLSASDRLRFSEAIAKASDNRDKNIRALELDVERNPWNVLDALPANVKTTDDETDETT